MAIVERMNRRWIWRGAATVLGGLAGFAYYHYIGCYTGSCPITGNPWISSAYGALIGWLALPKSVVKPENQSNSQSGEK